MKVHSRYAPDGSGGIYVDLGDDTWAAVRVTAGEWKIESSPCRFIRSAGMKPLATPIPGGSLEELRQFWNIGTEEQFRLAIVFILQAMRPVGPYVGEEVNGLPRLGKDSAGGKSKGNP